jgi:hypothetical protein
MERLGSSDLRRAIPNETWFAENGHLVGARPLEDEAFTELVAKVSARSPEPLNGRGRRTCLQAYRDDAERFGRLVEKALADDVRNPAGLLIRMAEAWLR